jgi:hypothetical protein
MDAEAVGEYGSGRWSYTCERCFDKMWMTHPEYMERAAKGTVVCSSCIEAKKRKKRRRQGEMAR